jgi:nicotinamidase-related amidase
MAQIKELPIPDFFDPDSLDSFWRVAYAQRAGQARQWAADYNLQPAAQDALRFGLLLIDVQNTFCLPDFELFVAGRSGTGAVEDNQRLCRFIYRNLQYITTITATMDTHTAEQIFHPAFLVGQDGNHPEPNTQISAADVRAGLWRVNPAVARQLGKSEQQANRYLQYYADQLAQKEKYDLTVWPYHAMLGGVGHALVSAVEEALFFHSLARYSAPRHIIKGNAAWTEAYSAIGPEILTDPDGNLIAAKNTEILNWLKSLDLLAVAGQAKSHCVAWTVSDLLDQIQAEDASQASKIYLLEDCTSPVVVPGVVDFTEPAEAAFERFAKAGMHRVRSTDPLPDWPGVASRFSL